MQSPVPRPSRNSPGFIPLPRLDSSLGGWRTPTSASTATSPWDDGAHNPFADMSSSNGRPHLRPLRLSLLQTRMDSASSLVANAPESPQPLSPLSPRRFDRSEGSALGIIVPPGTPPADALPRWLVDRRFSKQKSLLSGSRTPSRWPEPYSPFDSTFSSTAPAQNGWWGGNQAWVRTPEPLPIIEGLGTPRDEFPFDLGAVSGEHVRAPGGPMMRPRPLPRTSSDDMSDRRLFRVNAWGEHESPRDASTGLFSLIQGPVESRSQSRPRLIPSRLASTAPSPIPSPPV
ncbi:unnamed protein product [Rhizoctonia solani]|uniref:Uncharacterized protein n=1 Tax=Rhizoctonia solani AG-3 Rhs1AP TaxID=1086054 RepID=X8JQB0_9AGAM|nr:hypothetical protein RSOL_445270 [Rhizoctonia solani AG-3 Rhs1AP]CAE6526788.1 unnamed protein product [Rhizoctonia solani]